MKVNTTKCIIAILLIIIGSVSFASVSKVASKPENHKTTIASLDDKKETVLELTAATTATSALITLLPGDTATPIAEKMADLSTYLLVVLCAVFLEKYLVTITGYAAFRYLIPAACVLFLINLAVNNETIRKLASKLLIFGLAIFVLVPASVKMSDLIENTYRAQIESAMEEAKETQDIVGDVSDRESTTEAASDTQSDRKEQSANNDTTSDSGVFGFLDKAKDAISNAKDSVNDAVSNVAVSSEELVKKVENTLNRFIEAVAVMIITSCVIPILVMVFFFWLIKILLEVDVAKSKVVSGLLTSKEENKE
ncbi:MAG: hypothetical protein PUC55_11500 [Lachnospiraceae bacterium]|nr:hypothetical protein [Lachnospiraceae bacterium]HCJ07136.1 hypothetical protein [Lachnospiraceae bacterium]